MIGSIFSLGESRHEELIVFFKFGCNGGELVNRPNTAPAGGMVVGEEEWVGAENSLKLSIYLPAIAYLDVNKQPPTTNQLGIFYKPSNGTYRVNVSVDENEFIVHNSPTNQMGLIFA